MDNPSRLVPTLAAALVSLTAAACGAAPLRDHAGPYELQVLVDGAPTRTYRHAGESFVLGRLGERYTLRVVNRSPRRVEAVVTVDGRDVIDGRPGDLHKSGWLVPAWGSVDIDGWRVSQAEAAAFRFSRVADSYAARTGGGRDVGVIGVALFPERLPPPPPPPPRRPIEPTPSPWGSSSDGPARLQPPAPAAAAPNHSSSFAQSSPASDDCCSDERAHAEKARRRSGLGTEFGEAVQSPTMEIAFERESPARPTAILGVRYDDRDGLLAMGVDLGDRCCGEPFPVVDRRYAEPPPGWRR